jgi:hypothetical protein
MTDQQQEARTLTLGERMVLAARLAVVEHLRQSVITVPLPEGLPESFGESFRDSYFGRTDYSDAPPEPMRLLENSQPAQRSLAAQLVGAP